MPGGPVVKASQLQSVLEEVDRLPPGLRGAIHGQAGPEALRAVADAAGSDWLPFALELRLTRAVHDALGPDGAHHFFREHQLRAFSSATFRFLVDGATTLFGLDPGSWARWIPRGWGLVFRECGQWVVEPAGAGEVRLALMNPPAGSLQDAVWLASLASSFSAFVDLARKPGECTLARVDGPRRTAWFSLWWRAVEHGGA